MVAMTILPLGSVDVKVLVRVTGATKIVEDDEEVGGGVTGAGSVSVGAFGVFVVVTTTTGGSSG